MVDAGQTPAEQAVLRNVQSLLKRRASPATVTLGSDLYDDLEMDSLEVAELSAALEEELGSDPYTEGLFPRTIGEVAEFYAK